MPPSITWGTLKAQIARKLSDPTYQTYSEQLLLDAVNDALLSFASAHTGLASDFIITGDGTTHLFSLPANVVDSEHAGVYAVQWVDQEWIYEEKYWPKMKFQSTSRGTASLPVAYILWPDDRIDFTRVPATGNTITVHYVAYYPDVANDASTIQVPFWAREAIKYYVCAMALAPNSASTASLRRWQTRREAGKPEDNPLLRLAEYYLLRYYQLMAEHPIPQYKLDMGMEDYR